MEHTPRNIRVMTCLPHSTSLPSATVLITSKVSSANHDIKVAAAAAAAPATAAAADADTDAGGRGADARIVTVPPAPPRTPLFLYIPAQTPHAHHYGTPDRHYEAIDADAKAAGREELFGTRREIGALVRVD